MTDTRDGAPHGLVDPMAQAAGSAATSLPPLGPRGWLRWAWRQLTSMRVALLLLMLLAVAAVPGSLVPQRPVDPSGVAEHLAANPVLGPWLDRLGVYDVYGSAWFSAIYLLLTVSLVGCILPRARLQLRVLRARPPRTPRRLDRFPAGAEAVTALEPEAAARTAAAALRGRPRLPAYRVDVAEESPGTWTVSAERGYLRETGNIVFHLALLGLLLSIAAGQLLHYRAQVVVVQGRGFANAQTAFDSFEAGRWLDPASLPPFVITLDSFAAEFDPATAAARDFAAEVTVTEPGQRPRAATLRVNHPLDVAGARVYLQGNGYAPRLTVRDGAGEVAFAGAVPFLPADEVYTSRGVVKIPDVTTGPQLGLQAVLLPTARQGADGVWASVWPQPEDPLLVFTVWTGDLGLDDGVPQNVYRLDVEDMAQAVDAAGVPVVLEVRPGQTVELPDGLGTVTFEDLPRFAALDVRHDPALPFLLAFALLALAGLTVSLFLPRRRVWLRVTRPHRDEGPTVVTAAALARGDDAGLQAELDRVVRTVEQSR